MSIKIFARLNVMRFPFRINLFKVKWLSRLDSFHCVSHERECLRAIHASHKTVFQLSSNTKLIDNLWKLRSLVSFNNFLIYGRVKNSDTSHIYESKAWNSLSCLVRKSTAQQRSNLTEIKISIKNHRKNNNSMIIKLMRFTRLTWHNSLSRGTHYAGKYFSCKKFSSSEKYLTGLVKL